MTAYLAAHACVPPMPKKAQVEFTAQEKLGILKQLEDVNARNKSEGAPPITVEQICIKYHTPKSSLHWWKQQHQRGRLQALTMKGLGYTHNNYLVSGISTV